MSFFAYCPDQDSAGLSAYFAMANYYKLMVWPMFDGLHRVHNDIYLGISASGNKPVVLLCTILFNLSWGPWASCSWFEQLKEEASAYWSTASSSDPIFQHLRERIRRHSGDCSEAADFQTDEETFSALCESSFLLRKGSKVLLSRWGSWLKCMRSWAPQWHKRLLLLWVYGITHGFCKKGAAAVSLNGALRAVKDSGRDTTMKAQKNEIRALRDKCANTMELALHLHNEESLYAVAMMISRAAAPLEKWHMKWLSELRSRQKALEYNMGVVSGCETMPTIVSVFDGFYDEAFLEHAGFVVERLVSTNLFVGVSDDSIEAEVERAQAAKMGQLCMALAQQRFLSLAHRMFGLPDLFLLVAHSDEAWEAFVVQKLKAIGAAWDAIQGLTAPFWKSIRSQSPMNMPLAQALFRELRSHDWAISDDLLEVCRRVAMAFMTSALTERGFQGCRAVEQEYPDRKMGALEMWHKITGDQMLSQANHFSEVTATEMDIDAPVKSMLPRKMWDLDFRGQSINFKGVVSCSAKAPYQRFNPTSMATMHEGLELMVELHSTARLHLGAAAWRTMLVRPGALVEFSGLDGLFLVFSHRCLSLCLWPVNAVQFCGKTCFGLPRDADSRRLCWRCVTDFSQLKVTPYAFLSPLEIFIANGHQWPGSIPEVFGVVTGAPESPIRSAARFGFKDTPMGLVDKLLRLEYGENTDGMAKPAKLLSAVQKALDCSLEAAADILECRLTDAFDSVAIADILQTDGAQDIIDTSDHKMVKEYCETARDTTEEKQQLETTIRKIRQAAAKSKPRPAAGRRNSVKLPGDKSITQQEAKRLLAPGAKIRRGDHQKRWQVTMGVADDAGGRWLKSRSWGLGGDERAAVEFVIKCAWERHSALTGAPNPLG